MTESIESTVLGCCSTQFGLFIEGGHVGNYVVLLLLRARLGLLATGMASGGIAFSKLSCFAKSLNSSARRTSWSAEATISLGP